MRSAGEASSNVQNQSQAPKMRRESRPPRRSAIVLQIGIAILALGGTIWLYLSRSNTLRPMVTIEFGLSPTAAARRVGHEDMVWRYAWWILGALALALICHIGRRLLVSPVWWVLSKGILVGAVAAAVLALLEALLLVQYSEIWWPGRVWIMRAVQAMAFTRNCLLAVAIPLSVGVLVMTAVRVYRSIRNSRHPSEFKEAFALR